MFATGVNDSVICCFYPNTQDRYAHVVEYDLLACCKTGHSSSVGLFLIYNENTLYEELTCVLFIRR